VLTEIHVFKELHNISRYMGDLTERLMVNSIEYRAQNVTLCKAGCKTVDRWVQNETWVKISKFNGNNAR